jgi:glycosyltransferase involved in cell wall biosynthesis
VIFVDDCSSDNTYQILSDIKHSSRLNIQVFKNEKNIGPGLTRRFAAGQAVGKYLCFCDSDDWFEYNSLYELHSYVHKTFPDVIIFDMSYVLNGKIINQKLTSNFIHSSRDSYIINCGESLCNMCVKKDLFLKHNPLC